MFHLAVFFWRFVSFSSYILSRAYSGDHTGVPRVFFGLLSTHLKYLFRIFLRFRFTGPTDPPNNRPSHWHSKRYKRCSDRVFGMSARTCLSLSEYWKLHRSRSCMRAQTKKYYRNLPTKRETLSDWKSKPEHIRQRQQPSGYQKNTINTRQQSESRRQMRNTITHRGMAWGLRWRAKPNSAVAIVEWRQRLFSTGEHACEIWIVV